MTDINARRLDWTRILQDLKDNGCSLYKAAKILGRPETTIQSWWKGHEPSHSNGAAILQLHSALCGEELTKLRCNEEVVYGKEKKTA